jgi:predicted nuclease of predicted toxin-antitoxin system
MRPRLLLNENVPLPSVKRLRGAGWDVLAIAESHASIDDAAVMRLARESARWLITFDRDYGELVFRQDLPPPPLVLLLRVPSYSPEEPAAWIDILYRREQLAAGYFDIYGGEAVRRRPFPTRAPERPN